MRFYVLQKIMVLIALALSVLAVCSARGAEEAAMGVSVKEAGDTVRVEFGGQLFTEYNSKNVDRPYFFPVIGPTGENLTRFWPMKDGVEGEQKDHPHHRGLWYAHGKVNGIDFWSEAKNLKSPHPKIVHQKFTKLESGAQSGVIESEDEWVAADGKSVCSDRRRYVFCSRGEIRMLDFEVTLIASHGKLVMGDTKEGSMAIRVPETMRLKGPIAKGHILNSEGVKDDATWGKRARWCLYCGPVKEQTAAIAILDHPQNPCYPTWWHVRDYGLFAANPFGVAEFEKGKGPGDLTVEEGKSIAFRYRFVFLKGEPKAEQIEALAKEFAATKE
jgi:hypothetical protein